MTGSVSPADGGTTDPDLALVVDDIRAVVQADPSGIHPHRSDHLAVLLAEYDRRGAELAWLDGFPVNEVDEPQLASALAVVEATAPSHDVPAWVAIELYNALDVARRELAEAQAREASTRRELSESLVARARLDRIAP